MIEQSQIQQSEYSPESSATTDYIVGEFENKQCAIQILRLPMIEMIVGGLLVNRRKIRLGQAYKNRHSGNPVLQ